MASVLPSRTMFEPFHPRRVQGFAAYSEFHYARPYEEDPQLLAFCQTVFSGTIRHPWVDREVNRIFPKFRVIKDIRLNLFLKWVRVRFPELPILFVIRHPCAVVLSRMRGEWATDAQVALLLSQPQLIQDFLGHRLDVIEHLETDEEKHALIWCISNLVPLRQFQPGEMNVVFYENLCLRPEIEVPRMLGYLRATGMEPSGVAKALKRIDRPSTTTRQSSAIMRGSDKVRRWRNELSAEQVDRIFSVVRAFDLDFLYGDSDVPVEDPWKAAAS